MHFTGAHVIVPHVQSVAAAASRRRVLRGLGSVASVVALGGCAGLASGGPRFDASAIVASPTLLMATTRKPVNGGRTKPWYGPERASSMHVARVKLTPPDDGRFSLASVGLADWQVDKIEPAGQIADLIPATAGGHDVLLYVHGYNTTFETAVLDAARLSDGIKFVGETMVFSWPSRASLLDYGYDRESAMWSRDSLQQVLDGLATSTSSPTASAPC
jgi:esterase/lipase superfamily enzyme